jgi:hypothetical protein
VEVLGLPIDKQHLLPDGYEILMGINEASEHVVLVIDEVALQFHARRSLAAENLAMDQLLTISRQRDQSIIFATHNFRKMDVALISDLDALAFKKPSLLHSRFERSEIRTFTKKAMGEFEDLEDDQFKSHTYVVSSFFEGMLENGPPSFWTDELSRGFASMSRFATFFIQHGIVLNQRELHFLETEELMAPYREWMKKGQGLTKTQARELRNVILDQMDKDEPSPDQDGSCGAVMDCEQGKLPMP